MALEKGTNTYVTVDEADAYFGLRLDVAAWDSADIPQKEKALATASLLLDNMPWIGSAISETQPMAFPREAVYFEAKVGKLISLSAEIPRRVLTAQMELAYHLLNNDGVLDDTGGLGGVNIEGLVFSGMKDASKVPDLVRAIIGPLLKATARTVWRAN